MKYTKAELDSILEQHALWLKDSSKGERADLTRADLYGASLGGASLGGANLGGANLRDVNLRGANLRGANLYGAILVGANLVGANLVDADLYGAGLRGVNLRYANLYGAILVDADLSGAILPHFQIPPQQGSFEAYKATATHILHLLIPDDAKRTSALIGRKCRASKVIVLDILNKKGKPLPAKANMISVKGWRSVRFQYTLGETIYADKYDPDIRVECTHGIHFFMTKEEAIQWLN